jgi:hypothetical protein
MACSSEHNVVIYLVTVTSRIIQIFLIPKREDPQLSLVNHILEITQVATLTFSLLINIFATSIIALKTWCVGVYGVIGKYFAQCALIDDATCVHIGNTASC